LFSNFNLLLKNPFPFLMGAVKLKVYF